MLLVDIRLVVRLVIDAALPLLLHILGRAAQDIQLALGLHHVGKMFTQHCLKAYLLAYHKKLGTHSAALSRLKVVMNEAIFTSPAIVTCLDCFWFVPRRRSRGNSLSKAPIHLAKLGSSFDKNGQFVGKARSLPLTGAPEMCFTRVCSGLTHKRLNRSERLVRDKQSS
jgi:hypothetical protein